MSPLDWSDQFTLAQPMTFTGTPTDAAAVPLAQLSVTPYGTKYLAAASSDVLVAELAGAGWTAVYSVNGDPHNTEDVKLYRGQFAAPNPGVLPPVP